MAVGSQAFIDKVRTELGLRAKGRRCEQEDSGYVLRERMKSYTVNIDSKISVLSPE